MSSQRESSFPLIYAGDAKPPGPLFVASASASNVVSHIELTKTASKSTSGDGTNAAMSTFYNPFESKRIAGGMKKARDILEGEERVISVKFGNKLSIPVEVTNAHLIFEESDVLQLISTALSFTVPPNSNNYMVNFPFTVMRRESSGSMEMAGVIGIKGIECDYTGRVEFIQISIDSSERPNAGISDNIPVPASMYPFVSRSKTAAGDDAETSEPVIQALPPQPALEVRLAESNLPVSRQSIDLKNGALYTSPPFRLYSYSGALKRGHVDRLEMYVSGVAGINQKIFDNAAPSSDLETDDEFLKGVLETKMSVPIKIRVNAAELSLDGINRHDAQQDASNIFRFQIASGYDTTRKLPKLSVLKLKLRYRGSSLPGLQVWRSKEIDIDIVTTQGPHISSVSFLQETKLSHLLRQANSSESPNFDSQAPKPKQEKCFGNCIGGSTSANLCNKEVEILVTVTNESRHAIELSKENSHLGVASCVPIDKLRLRPSLTIKIPMILSRIEVRNKEEILKSIVDEIERSTTITWKSEGDISEGNSGRIRIPRSCLEDLVRKDSSLVSKLVEPPLNFEMLVDDSSSSEGTLHLGRGSPGAKVCAKIKVADWVSEEEKDSHDVIVELVCVQDGNTSTACGLFNWAGKVHRRMQLSSTLFEHNARIIFHRPGIYLVSACAKIVNKSEGEGEGNIMEVWCSPFSRRIVVSETTAQ